MKQGHLLIGKVKPEADWRNRAASRAISDSAVPDQLSLGRINAPDRGFTYLLKIVPVLWLSGLLAFCTPLFIIYSFIRTSCWKQLRDPTVGGWFAIAAVQGMSTIINWGNTSEGFGSLIYRFFSAPISGWVFLGMLVALGKHCFSEDRGLVEGVSLQGVYLLCLGIPLLLAGLLFGISQLEWLTPIGHLIPASLPSARFQFTAQFLFADDLLGRTLPRLVLFYPWPTCLGFAGASIFFISLTRRRTFLNLCGVCGGVFGLLASASRAAIVGAMIALGVYALLQCPVGKRSTITLGIIMMALTGLFAPVLFQADPMSVIKGAERSVTSLREGSSSGRQDLYDETWLQFKRAPYLGYGWQGSTLEDYIPLNLGSHSTIYGLLYTGGTATIIPFVFTALAMALRLGRNAWKGGKQALSALCVFLVLMTMCYGECIYAFAIPVFFSFIWIGSALNETNSPRSAGGRFGRMTGDLDPRSESPAASVLWS